MPDACGARPAPPVRATEAALLFDRCYRELHQVAARQLRFGGPQLTLSATTLLHQAYLNLASSEVAFERREHFLAYAGRAMRMLVIDYVRERRALKRGGAFEFVTLDTEVEENVPHVESIGLALDELEQIDPRLAQLVDLKFFCGFSFREIAEMWSISERSVQREWAKARLLLRQQIAES